MKIRQSNSETLSCKVYIHENKKEELFVVSVPDIFFSIQFDYELYGEALIEYLYLHLFNTLDEQDAHLLAMRVAQWVSEV